MQQPNQSATVDHIAKELLRIEREVREENGEAEQRLREKCRWERMSRTAVIREWGDPRNWTPQKGTMNPQTQTAITNSAQASNPLVIQPATVEEILLPCPCCGAEAELDRMRGFRAMHDGHIGNAVAIYCLKCGLEISMCHEDFPHYDVEGLVKSVIGMWNVRMYPEASTRATESLREELNTAIDQGTRLVRENANLTAQLKAEREKITKMRSAIEGARRTSSCAACNSFLTDLLLTDLPPDGKEDR